MPATAGSDNVQWTFSAVQTELVEFESALLLAERDAVALDEVRRRFDILYNRAEIAALRAPLRALSLGGVERMAVIAGRERGAVVGLLIRLALATTGLVVLLLATLGVLVRLNRDMGRRRRAPQMTTSRLCATVCSAIDAMIVPEADRAALRAGMERFRETGEMRMFAGGRVELVAKRRNGEVFPAEISVSTAESESGKIPVSFLRDISARKAAEAELMRARDEALAGARAKANLLAVMSHEMRTPLNGLLGTMELMRDTDLDPAQRDHLAVMDSAGQLLLSHVNDVLDLSYLDSGRAEAEAAPFDLDALLAETVSMHQALARVNDNRLVLAPGPRRGRVAGDAPRLRQVLVNLIGNALKFTRGGSVTLRAARSGDRVEIAVRDTGIGIAPEDRARIFEAFFTADPTYGRAAGGTGLVFAITARLVRLLGGEIAVDSHPARAAFSPCRCRCPRWRATHPWIPRPNPTRPRPRACRSTSCWSRTTG